MPVGRPLGGPIARAIIKRLADEGRATLDVDLDQAWLRELSPDIDDAMYRMQKAGFAHRIQKGRYVVNVDGRPSRFARLDALDPLAPAVLNRLNHEWYLSWHSALWHYGLIDQQASRLYVAVTARKRRAHMGRNDIRFVTVNERKFFGWERIETFGEPLNMATVEKAILDSFDLPRLAAPIPVIANAMRDAWREGLLSTELLVSGALRFESPTLNRRLGFFMDLYGMPDTEELALRIGRKSAVALAPGREPEPGTTNVNPRWLVFEDPGIVGAAKQLR
jgi:predicted transcriptional regulator of viral defense system